MHTITRFSAAPFALLVGLSSVCSLWANEAHAEKSKLAVVPIAMDENVRSIVPADIYYDTILTVVAEMGKYEVIGQNDIQALLGFEKNKELLGCDDVSCLAEIGGALGVERLLQISIALIEGEFALTCKIMNTRTAKVEARTREFIKGSGKTLLKSTPRILDNLFRRLEGKPPRQSTTAESETPKRTSSGIPKGNGMSTQKLIASTATPGPMTPPGIELTPIDDTPSEYFGYILIGASVALAGFSVVMDVAPASAQNYRADGTDLIPLVGYGVSLGGLIWGVLEL